MVQQPGATEKEDSNIDCAEAVFFGQASLGFSASSLLKIRRFLL
jgi:hypothetical protein